MPRFYVKQGASWRNCKEVWVKDSGTWRNCKEVWAKKNGVWRQIFRDALELNIDADTTDYDLFTAAGSPTSAVDIVLTVGLNVRLYASSTSKYSIDCSTPLPAGSTVQIINKGYICGAGGNGGSFTGQYFSSTILTDGTPGGPALRLGAPTIINNAAGYLFGGGGGGSAQWFLKDSSSIWQMHTCAGGGGAGSVPGSGGINTYSGIGSWPASPGTIHGPGYGNVYIYENGLYPAVNVSGGGYGSPGLLESFAVAPNHLVQSNPGDAGRAVDRNGFSLSFTAGENAAQLKGAYD